MKLIKSFFFIYSAILTRQLCRKYIFISQTLHKTLKLPGLDGLRWGKQYTSKCANVRRALVENVLMFQSVNLLVFNEVAFIYG